MTDKTKPADSLPSQEQVFVHTPGPWIVKQRFDVYEDAGPGVGGTYIGTTRGNGELPEGVARRCEADARLFAESPRMYELLQRLVSIDWCIGYELTEEQHVELDDIRSDAASMLSLMEKVV